MRKHWDELHAAEGLQASAAAASSSNPSRVHATTTQRQPPYQLHHGVESTPTAPNTSLLMAYEEAREARREAAFKAVLIIALSLTVCSWACMSSVFPLVYQFMGLSNSQFVNVLEFCEDTARTASEESTMVMDEYLRLASSRSTSSMREEKLVDGNAFPKLLFSNHSRIVCCYIFPYLHTIINVFRGTIVKPSTSTN